MGYDDNRPLSGVTGGGLPADVWRETMTRVLAGRPSVPLPMDAPVMAGNGSVMGGGSTVEVADQVLTDLLNSILGDGN